MESRGGSSKQALSDLIGQSAQRGGAQSQDADARAISDAASMQGGDLVSNLQTLGSDSMYDPAIREMQKRGESKGYTPELRLAINNLRNKQSSAAQDANHMGQITFTPTGGSGGGGESGFSMPRGGGMDELGTIAQLLAQYKGNRDYNAGLNTVGMDRNHQADITSEDSAHIQALQPIYDMLMQQKQMELQMMQNKAREQQGQSQTAHGGGIDQSASRNQEQFQPNLQHALNYGNDMVISRNQSLRPVQDPYADVRNEAIRAALRALHGRAF